MDESLGKRAHALLMQALDREGAERTEFLARACAGDEQLRGRVRELAAALTRSSTFLERPVFESRAIRPAARAPVAPVSIRGYRILRVLGVGGMATVYEAEQDHPRRSVALKVMRNGLGETSAVHRFRFETEVLARLQHPAIAQIYEAGTYDDGHGRSMPFFAMEHVANASTLTEFVRARGLALSERLRLFIDVCDAVQHGHQHGVIHRDLKPGNILVDAAGRPKVIDFGVARSSDAEQAWITRDSDLGSLVGTLHYMSPEQCTANATIDVRTDVYSLGVVLYELIAGRVPHDLSRTPLVEAVRVITQDPPRPIAAHAPEARGDLSAIVGMALEKEPRRRYASVGALAADVRRFLSDQPIDARPATTLYQLRKFARRNRAVVIGTAAVFCSLLAGIVSTTRMAILAQRAQRSAEARERELTQVTAFQQAQLSQIDIAAMGRRLRASLAEMLTAPAATAELAESRRLEFERLLADVNFTTLAMRNLDEFVLQRSYDAIHAQFAQQPLIQAALLQRLGATMQSLGLPNRAAPLADEALSLRSAQLGPDHLDTLETSYLRATALSSLGQYDAAIAAFRDLLERSTRLLGPEDEKTLMTASGLATALRYSGDLDAAEQIWRRTLETQRRALGEDHLATLRTMSNIGIVHALRGRTADAEATWRDVLERRRRKLPPDHPELRGSLGNLGLILHEQGKLAEARALLEEDLALSRQSMGDEHPSTLDSMLNLSSVLLDLKEFSAAEQLRRECLEGRRRVFGVEHPSSWRAQGALAHVLGESGCLIEAEELFRAALAGQRRKLDSDHPDTIETLVNLSGVLRLNESLIEAEAVGAEAVARARRTHGEQHPAFAGCLVEHGRALARLGRWDEAESELLQARRILLAAYGEQHQHVREADAALTKLQELVQITVAGEN